MTDNAKRLKALVELTNRVDQLQRTVGRIVAHHTMVAQHMPRLEELSDSLEHDIRRELAAAKEALVYDERRERLQMAGVR